MKPIDDKKETVTIALRAVSRNEEGRKRVEKVEADTRDLDTLRHIEKKLVNKGIQRLERRPSDGIPLKKQPKAGHGGKYTWEGPEREAENELNPAPAALDERDPNYVDEEAEGRVLKGEASEAEGLVVGEVEVAKVAEEGVARVDVADSELLKV